MRNSPSSGLPLLGVSRSYSSALFLGGQVPSPPAFLLALAPGSGGRGPVGGTSTLLKCFAVARHMPLFPAFCTRHCGAVPGGVPFLMTAKTFGIWAKAIAMTHLSAFRTPVRTIFADMTQLPTFAACCLWTNPCLMRGPLAKSAPRGVLLRPRAWRIAERTLSPLCCPFPDRSVVLHLRSLSLSGVVGRAALHYPG